MNKREDNDIAPFIIPWLGFVYLLSLLPPDPVQIFPETWLWEEVDLTTSDSLTVTRTVPDTITTWLLSGFAISQETGLGIYDNQASLVVLKDFFIEPKLPFSLVRSESVKVVVGIFNYGNVALR